MPTLLSAASTIDGGVLADPTGVVGIAAGHKLANTGRQLLRVVNSASNANAVISLVPGGTVSGGTFLLELAIAVGGPQVVYTTATIPFNNTPAQIATALLAATQPNGNALSADFPSGVITGGGSALNSGTATLTFTGGFAHTPIPDPAVNAAAITGGGTVNARVTTAGTGSGLIWFAGAPGYGPLYYTIPAASTGWLSVPSPNLVNQVGADGGQAYLFYDIPAQYTVTLFQHSPD